MRVLLADDEKLITVTLGDALRGAGFETTVVHDGEQAIRSLRQESYDCVITDVRMPKADGMAVLRTVKELHPRCRVILMTTYASVDSAVAAIKEGAYDYVQKPFFNEDVIAKLKNLQKVVDLEEENRRLKDELTSRPQFGSLVGTSPKMRAVFDLIVSVAPKDVGVLIQGESGTGKELVAEAIHFHSPRRDRPFVAMNCSAVPETLLESELFGHVKGAFTDARADRQGRFERAHAGTIFIDDIDDLRPAAQVKFLRVLQERTFERVGDSRPVKVDVRVLCATKKDLWKLVGQGAFREDLFYRLNVVKIELPPLRERAEDIPLLVRHFIHKHGHGEDYDVAPEVMESVQAYGWKGNVRELEQAVVRSVALSGEDRFLKREHLLQPVTMEGTGVVAGGALASLRDKVAEAEARHIRSVLAYTGGHKGEAARILGITRKNLWEKMKQYAIGGGGEEA
ncbi:MAG: sigma-54-dependent Fis family transcriptional regulator [Planctomycetes bacterium]|nr:sigma-54-dependent Fis family transcriptional regulator [Planctomycetota bacterium]